MATVFSHGVPALVDVTFSDREASKKFYGELFGWSFDGERDPSGTYTYAVRDGDVVAGLRPGQPEQPFAWTLYFGVDDMSAAADKIGALGGHVIFQNSPEGQGSVLIGTDPTGGVFGLWRPESGEGLRQGEPGTLTWAELKTRDSGAADRFYQGLLGYTAAQIGDGENYDYSVYSLNDDAVLGRHRADAELANGVPPHWLVYFAVDPATGTDTMANRAVKLGGRVIVEPMDIPAGRIAVISDPDGAAFAVVDQSKAQPRE